MKHPQSASVYAPPPADTTRTLVASHALLPTGWAREVLLAWDEAGTLVTVTPGAAHAHDAPRARGVVIAGMPNLHSHAFQRAFAGLSEIRSEGEDGFWRWRDHMYRAAAALTPGLLEDIATQLYIEMLRAGYTSVCEFHYVHHDPQGRPHARRAEMALRIVAAARRAGIGLTLLPVLYRAGGFGAALPLPAQRRFLDTVDGLLRGVEELRALGVRTGAAPHSLRAVPPEALAELLAGLRAIDARAPVHIHVAEQQQEVDDCIAWSGQRPVQWLLEHAEVDARWCLVHATHVDAAELRALAACGACVGLCPSTEANLGDGVFPAARHLEGGGRWGIGSDSHVSVDAAQELRLLEYGQRLTLQRRNVLASSASADVAQHLWQAGVTGGARASARPVAGLCEGQQADFVVLSDDGVMQDLSPAHILSSHVFACHAHGSVREVWVGGRLRIIDGEHAAGDEVRRRFVTARAQLLNGL